MCASRAAKRGMCKTFLKKGWSLVFGLCLLSSLINKEGDFTRETAAHKLYVMSRCSKDRLLVGRVTLLMTLIFQKSEIVNNLFRV